MIDGVTSGAFSAVNLGPWPESKEQYVQQILESSRNTYTRPRAEVEKHILEWTLGNSGSSAGTGAGAGNSGKQDQNKQQEQTEKPKLADTPRYVKEEKPRVDTKVGGDTVEVKMPPIPEIPRANRPSEPKKSERVHNPFKKAFAELGKENSAQATTDYPAQKDVPRQTPPPVQGTAPVSLTPTAEELKKEVDENTLKDILGV